MLTRTSPRLQFGNPIAATRASPDADKNTSNPAPPPPAAPEASFEAFADSPAHDMERARRPHAARRLRASQEPRRLAVLPASAPAPPLAITAAGALERARRPRAARRLAAERLAPHEHHLASAAVVGPSFASTAAGALEATRRSRAAKRLRVSSQDRAFAEFLLGGAAAADSSRSSSRAPAPALADTAFAAMESARRPRAAMRARRALEASAPRSILHPEMVGEFAVRPRRLTLDDALDKNLAALARMDVSGGGDSPTAFATLERMLDARIALAAETPPGSRGGSLRGAANFRKTNSSASLSTSRGHLARCDSKSGMADAAANVVARASRVRCEVEGEGGDVVCRIDGDVLEVMEPERVAARVAALAREMEAM